MPPPKKPFKKRAGCRHCLIWFGKGADGYALFGCAHCPYVKNRVDLAGTYSEELIDRQISASRSGHRLHCPRLKR